MKKLFDEFCENIRLTQNQQDDAKTKYDNVCATLHKYYYDTKYNGCSKFLFGSYKTKTNIRPFPPGQDVDVVFKIPEETYTRFSNHEGNGQSALLQEIRKILQGTFTTTDKIKAWGKVILIQFADSTHNVEVLPAYETVWGTLLIPDTGNGGSWEVFNPKEQLDNFFDSNKKTSGVTADMIRMIKAWKNNTPSVQNKYSSFDIVSDVTSYFSFASFNEEYPYLIRSFFDYINSGSLSGNSSVVTALNRINKAIEYMENDDYINSSIEWRKVWGDVFPKAKSNPVKNRFGEARKFDKPSWPYGE